MLFSTYCVYGAQNNKVEILIYPLTTDMIIVRAFDPGLFEPEQDVSWSNHPNSEAVYRPEKIVVVTNQFDQALTVQGNIQDVSEILQPSDKRIKQIISAVDMENGQNIQVVQYHYKPEYLRKFSNKEKAQIQKKQTGVAQDFWKVFAYAVGTSGDLMHGAGADKNYMLIKNKDRPCLENFGAVWEFSKSVKVWVCQVIFKFISRFIIWAV